MKLNYLLEDEKLFKKPLRYISQNGLTYIKRGHFTAPILNVYNAEYSLLRTIELIGVLKRLQELGVRPVLNVPSLVGIFSRDDEEILLSFDCSIVVRIDKTGNILTSKVIYNNIEPKTIISNVWCNYEQFQNGQMGIIVNYGNQNLIGLSDNVYPTIGDEASFEFNYLNDVFTFPEKFNMQIVGMRVKERKPTIGAELRQLNEEYQHLENTPFEHYVTRYKIWSAIDIGRDMILLLIMTTGSNIRKDPNKNMPYFLFTINAKSGEIINRYSPDDRSIYKKNFNTKLFSIDSKNANLKTHDGIYTINENLDIEQTVSLKSRKYSAFRGFRVTGQSGNKIHFANDETGEIFNFSFGSNIEQDVEHLVKEFKIVKLN